MSGFTKAFLLAGCACLALPPASAATAQVAATKKVVRSQDDLPRFTYPVPDSATALLTADDATFGAFAAKVEADVDGVLAGYQIDDRATSRGLLSTKAQLQMLRGDDAGALKTLDQLAALEDKPDAKLLSGIRSRAMIAAATEAKAKSGAAYEAAYGKAYAAMLAPLPWAVVGNRVKESKASAQIITRDLVLGQAQANLDPTVAKTHQLSNELAWMLINLRFGLTRTVPVKAATVAVLTKDVAAKNVEKPDIWAAREVALTAADRPTPVNVAIWDSGSDLSLFAGRVYTDPKPSAQTDPHGIAFDLQSMPTHGYLYPLTPEQQALYPAMRNDLKAFSDLQLSIESPEADALKAKIAGLKPDQVPAFFEQLNFFGNYIHGTHVAGITARGNPAIRLAVARITFDWKNVPDKPTEELARRAAAASQAYVDWFKRNHIRVVNMSWGGSPAGYEDALEKNGVGKDAAERKVIAKKLFGIERDGLRAALSSAPDILFVCAAGNADSDSGFEEVIPAGLALPNMLVVGAVDQAGDEASFTSYGKTVLAHANGYQVESVFPGGTLVRESGTSMASPNAANLAAKLIALDPSLTPAQVIDLIVKGGTRSEDGRRNNIDPKKSVALLKARHAGHAAPATGL
jgi:subtilisin family serine protease